MFTIFNVQCNPLVLPCFIGTDFGFVITALIHGSHEKNDFFNGSSGYNAQLM
jgi:hypothetical protein